MLEVAKGLAGDRVELMLFRELMFSEWVLLGLRGFMPSC